MGEGSAGFVFAEKINSGEEEALDFVRFEHRPAASGDIHRRQAVSGHRRVARLDVAVKVAALVPVENRLQLESQTTNCKVFFF